MHPALHGEGCDYTALEQTNPAIRRMMETCAGVTWFKLGGSVLLADYVMVDSWKGMRLSTWLPMKPRPEPDVSARSVSPTTVLRTQVKDINQSEGE